MAILQGPAADWLLRVTPAAAFAVQQVPPPTRRSPTALSAEWVKVRTLPGTGWLPLAAVAVTVAVSGGASGALSCTSSAACHPDTTQLSLGGADVGQAVVAVIAVLAVIEEYATGMIRATLAAVLRRTVMLAATAIAVTALALTPSLSPLSARC